MIFSKNKENINDINFIYSKNIIKRIFLFLIGVFLLALAFNLCLLPNNIVYGISGVAVILNKLYGYDPSIVILVGSVLLLILSFILMGKEKTKNTIVGSLVYPLFVKVTEFIIPYFNFGNTEAILIVLLGALVSGFGLGLIFKAGYTTGGTDILNQIVSKYFKMSIGSSMFFTDGVIIFCSLFIFGWQKFLYSLVTIYIISIMTDKVILGISQSKTFHIITSHEEEVKKFILENLSNGITVIDVHGGYSGSNQKMIMCTISTKDYFILKEGLQTIDKNAFFMVTDTYEVFGGSKR